MTCSACGSPIARDKIRCGSCGKWQVGASASMGRRTRLADAAKDAVERLARDAVGAVACNGGYPRCTVTMVGGEPGTGKSTMMLQVASHFGSVLYLAAEESSTQIRERAERIDVPGLLDVVQVVECGEVAWIDGALEGPPCELVILDSLPGFVGAGNDAAAQAVLKAIKKHVVENRSCALVVDHATKSDFFAGRLTLQHEVDCTVVFTCSSPQGRVLTSVKNRHGPSGREEHLQLTERGLVPDPEAQAEAERTRK